MTSVDNEGILLRWIRRWRENVTRLSVAPRCDVIEYYHQVSAVVAAATAADDGRDVQVR